MVNRNYVLDLMKSRDTTIEDFNYDKLTCPPLLSLFTQYDIMKLKEIATSLKYSAKPRAKYTEIDKIMNSRGFVKLVAGTNRICYKCVEDDSFVIKIAYDKVGMNDNPREFVNQNYLKPFCTKVFEVAGDGVIASFERVQPILSREEFISIAKDVFTLLDEFVMGEYVLDDCGTKTFLNWGIRKGFGPVLLDFAFLYKLDGRKLFCNRPDKLSETGYCLGEIDSDPGFNNFVCKKCGAIYRAADLAADIEKNNIIIKDKGEYNKMKVTLKGGTNNINTTTTAKVEEIIPDVKNIVNTPSSASGASENNTKAMSVSLKSANVKEAKINDTREKINGSISVKKSESSNKVLPKKEEVIVEEVKPVEEEVKKEIVEEKKSISPIHFTSEQKSHETIIKEAIETILKTYTYLENSEKGTCENIIIDFIKNILIKMNINTDEVISIANSITGLDLGPRIINVEIKKEEEKIEEVETATEEYIDDTSDDFSEDYYVEENDTAEYDDYIIAYDGVKYFNAETIDISSIFTNLSSKNVIVLNDPKENSYLTTSDNKIIAIDRLNNIDTYDATIISNHVIVELTNNSNAALINEEVTVNGVPAAKE